MKTLITCLATFFLIGKLSLQAQEIPDPEFSLTPYYLKDNSLLNLERTGGAMGHKAKALGYGGVEIYWAVSNGKSPVRFTSVALPEIIIKVDDNSDPSEIFTLERMESRKDERRVKMFRGGGFSSLSKAKDPTIQISFKKVRDKIYQVIFTSQLSEGEYAFIKIKDKSIDATQIKISAFGID